MLDVSFLLVINLVIRFVERGSLSATIYVAVLIHFPLFGSDKQATR